MKTIHKQVETINEYLAFTKKEQNVNSRGDKCNK